MTGRPPPDRQNIGASREGRRLGWAIAGLALIVYVAGAGGSLTSTDAVVTFDVTRNIVEHGSVAMSGDLLGMAWHQGTDGRYYAPFGIGQSIANIPPYLAAKVFLAASGLRLGKPDTIPKAAVAMGQTVVAAALVWIVYGFGLTLTGRPRAAALGALTLAFATILWPYAGFGFNQPLAALMLVACLHDAVRGMREGSQRRLVAAGLWLAAGLLTRHEMALVTLPLVAWIVWCSPAGPRRWQPVAAVAPGLIGGIVIWMAYNAMRFGNPLDSGYLDDPVPGVGQWMGGGLAGLLVSPGASLFLYSPVVVAGLAGLWLMRRSAVGREAWLLLGVSATLVLFYGSLANWIGGRSYGSRYLLVIIPLMTLGWTWWLAQRQDARRLPVAVMVALGVAIQVPGVVVDYAKVSQGVNPPFTTEQRQWSWSASPLVLNVAAMGRLVPENVAYITGLREPPVAAPPDGEDDRSFSQQFAFSLDLWWLYLFYLGALPRPVLWATMAIIAGAIAGSAHVVRRLYRAEAVAYNRPV